MGDSRLFRIMDFLRGKESNSNSSCYSKKGICSADQDLLYTMPIVCVCLPFCEESVGDSCRVWTLNICTVSGLWSSTHHGRQPRLFRGHDRSEHRSSSSPKHPLTLLLFSHLHAPHYSRELPLATGSGTRRVLSWSLPGGVLAFFIRPFPSF